MFQYLPSDEQHKLQNASFNAYDQILSNQRIERNRSKSPSSNLGKFQAPRQSLTDKCFGKHRAKSQQKNNYSGNLSGGEIPDLNTEYTDTTAKVEKTKSRISTIVNNKLVNGDQRSLKSLKILLKRTNKFLKRQYNLQPREEAPNPYEAPFSKLWFHIKFVSYSIIKSNFM